MKIPFMSQLESIFLEQGKQEGKEEGILQTAKDSIITVLEVRLREIPPSLKEAINQISNQSKLKQLLERAEIVNSLIEFQQFIDTN